MSPRLGSEADRLRAVEGTGLLDTAPEEAFDRLTRLARRFLGVPVAMVTLVDRDRQFFKSAHGLPAPFDCERQTPLSHSLCRLVSDRRESLRIQDARVDPAFHDHPGARALNIVAYLGVPLLDPDGVAVGSFCVADGRAREWTAEDEETLAELAAAATSEMRLRAEIARRGRAEETLIARQAQVDLALAAAGDIGIWEWDVSEGIVRMDRSFSAVYGIDSVEAERGLPVEAYLSRIPDADRPGIRDRIDAAVREGGSYVIEHRVARPDGTEAWIQSRGRCVAGADGRPTRFVGVVIDVTVQHRALSHQLEMSQELGHRMKNLMATLQSVVVQTLRGAPDVETASRAVMERIGAMARAHDLVMLGGGTGSDLATVAGAMAGCFGSDRFAIEGPHVPLSPRVTLSLSMGLHELATNAVKYGALSEPDGRVRIAWTAEPLPDGRAVAIDWVETAGPAVSRPARTGLGSRLLKRVLAAEINGTVGMDFAPDGMRCRIEGNLPAA